MSMPEFRHWFRCPFCGDEGDTKLFLVGGSGGLEFTCKSRDHRLNRSRYSRFEREEWRSLDDWGSSASLFERLRNVFIGETDDRVTKLQGCIECPHCGSAGADGAVEQMVVRKNYTKYSVILATVWCPDCERMERNMLSSGEHSVKPTELAHDKSSFPPTYLDIE